MRDTIIARRCLAQSACAGRGGAENERRKAQRSVAMRNRQSLKRHDNEIQARRYAAGAGCVACENCSMRVVKRGRRGKIEAATEMRARGEPSTYHPCDAQPDA